MHWLDLFSQFDMTLHHIPGKSSFITNALSHCPNLAVVIESVESGLLAQTHEAYAAASSDSWE